MKNYDQVSLLLPAFAKLVRKAKLCELMEFVEETLRDFRGNFEGLQEETFGRQEETLGRQEETFGRQEETLS